MITPYPIVGEAYRLKVLFNKLWAMPDKPAAEAVPGQCGRSGIGQNPCLYEVRQYTPGAFGSGIVHFVESRITNGILEGINSKIDAGLTASQGLPQP
jgi:transposase